MASRRRIFLDISTPVRDPGRADGIGRTARELALWAVEHRRDVTCVFYDIGHRHYVEIRPEWGRQVLEGGLKVDTSHLPDPWSPHRRFRHRLPAPLGELVRWIQSPRRKLFLLLEQRRISGRLGSFGRRLQDSIMSERYALELLTPGGRRRALLSPRAAPVVADPGRGDVIVLIGAEWHRDYVEWLTSGSRQQATLVMLCYDIIPLMFPAFFPQLAVDNFRLCFHRLFGAAGLTIFTAKRIESDCQAYCDANGIALNDTALFRLGARPPALQLASAAMPDAQLPPGLMAGRYALFVSTIEPRKGHRLLFSIWQRLLAEGIPQATGFKLVFVGRRGWLVDELLAELDAHPSAGESLLMFSNVDDQALASFYRNAAFCLYPSLYEGFGLPVIEAFCYGKPVLASSAGALPETVGAFSPCLDPANEALWYETMKQWITRPPSREPYERAIRDNFYPHSWDDAAAVFFELIDEKIKQASPHCPEQR